MSSIQRLSKSPTPTPSKTFDNSLALARLKPRSESEPGYSAAPRDGKAPDFADYQYIGPPDEVANDTIRYETQDGDRVIVLRSTSPALYEQVKKDFETLKALNEATAGGDRRAGKDDKATQSLRDYPAIESVTPEVLRFRNRDGDWTVLARADNPEMFDKVSAFKDSLDGIEASAEDGYRRASDNETWPGYSGLGVGAVDEMGPGLIRYHNGDEKVVVHRDDNPGLFDYLAKMQKLIGDDASRGAMDRAQGAGHRLLERDGEPPAYADYARITWEGSLGDNGIITYQTWSGEKVAVSEAVSPEMFAALKQHAEIMLTANAQEKEGYAMLHPDDYLTSEEIAGALIGPEGEIGDGFVRAEIVDGDKRRKIVVSRELSPDLYDRLVAEDSGRRNDSGKIDDARRDSDLPLTGELDIGSMETSETDPDDSSRALSVNELTWQKVIEGWKKGIEDGSIKEDDDRARMYRALRAQGTLEGGLDMVTLDIGKGQSTAGASGDDFESIIDGRKVDEQLTTLFASDSVQKDFIAAQKDAVDALPNKDEVVKKLQDMAFSEDYVRHIQGLEAEHKQDLAEADIRETYAQLAVLDPEKAAEFAQKLQLDAAIVDLDKLMENPALINDDNLALATQDVVKTLLTALKKAGVDLPRRTVESIDKFINEFLGDKQTAKDFGKALQELGDRFIKNGEVTQGDIDQLMKKDVYQALNEKTGGGMLSTISVLNSNGALGSTGGLISLASGIYQMAGGKLGGTPEERLAIAKDMVAFFGASQHFVNLGSRVIDTINGSHLNAMLGLDKSLPEIFGKDTPQNRPFTSEIGARFLDNIDELLSSAPLADDAKMAEKLNLSQADYKEVIKGMRQGFSGTPLLPDSTAFSRGAGAFLRILDAGANTFVGVADTVLGGLMIKKGADSGDAAMIAQGAITVAAGAFGVGGGAASFGALAKLSFARAAVGPLFWVSALLTIATLPFSIIEDIKYNNKLDAYRDDLKDLFNDLEQDGLLSDDGLLRYEFLDAYMHSYGQRDAPDDQSIFDYRSDEYDYFVDRGHTYWDGQHDDYEGDGKNLDSQMDRGSTVGS